MPVRDEFEALFPVYYKQPEEEVPMGEPV